MISKIRRAILRKEMSRIQDQLVPGPPQQFLVSLCGDLNLTGIVTVDSGTQEEIVQAAFWEALTEYMVTKGEADYADLEDEDGELAYCVHDEDFGGCPDGCAKIVLTWMS